ncbi:M23 family metallopeptidase [Paenibacillus wynnii]|uniref:Peptidase M23 n=1 Tax=Paenibacillus wynnii TaxID=268407 RepID=A0A098ME74_9BACL|nr:M23 family metallopeptidase [Paenibacillus wynnii]KGE20849.1 peptidase M23 [Paenibacillus wynnii]
MSLFKRLILKRSLVSLSAAAILFGCFDISTLKAAGSSTPQAADSIKSPNSQSDVFTSRKELYEQMSAVTGIPWFRLAAIDQYERTIAKKSKESPPDPGRLTGITIPAPVWCGPLNPDQDDKSAASISFFHGFGRDGSGDGMADPNNDIDLLYSMASHLMRYGNSPSDFSIATWEYYHYGRASLRITQFANLYEHFGQLDLSGNAFPLPLGKIYSYRSTWGTGRSWGGARIHEGTDLFTPHGMTVRSTCYGIVETKGWNRYGGWRVGIRDIDNRYHYYAHLAGYEKSLTQGMIVKPGQTIGWVGSSGYGKPGTQGKFPPHLHYGIYRDRGIIEWAFDPYPLLKQWENGERRALKKHK